jgi:hypothetical protein
MSKQVCHCEPSTPIADGQIKMNGASARWITILPMLQTKEGL